MTTRYVFPADFPLGISEKYFNMKMKLRILSQLAAKTTIADDEHSIYIAEVPRKQLAHFLKIYVDPGENTKA